MIGAAMVVAGAAAMPLPSSASGELPGFRATALAEGGRVTFSVPGFAVVEDVIDGGGPVSQAVVDGQGSSSFASLPYPGDTALAFPGLFAAVAGQALPAGYPFFVSASHPTSPHQELKDPAGAYRLSAEAAAAAASGLAQLRALSAQLHGDSRDVAVLKRAQPELSRLSAQADARYRAAGLPACAQSS